MLSPRFGRRRRGRYRRKVPLQVCVACGEAFVYPVTWSESGPESWWLLLRCGSCGVWRELFARDDAVEAYDRFLDRGTAAITREANQLDRERLAAQVDSFGEALRLGLIGADDFA